MQKYFWPIVTIFLALGCFDIAKKPENLLDKKQMSDVLYLIYLNKNYAILDGANTRVLDYELKARVLKDLKISEPVFDQSLDYYALHPSQHKEILEIVKKRFEKDKAKLKKTSQTTP